MKIRIVLGVFLSLWVSICAAQTVIVSDIDDTVKISHVRSKLKMVVRAFDTSSAFTGMPQLYRLMAVQTQAHVYYLSNAPEALMRQAHEGFLKEHGFPEGRLLLNSEGPASTNKIRHLRALVQREKPRVLILIGDNGERDIDVYDQARREFPGVRVIQFIRSLYSKSDYPDLSVMRAEQHAFVTPAEIALVLADEGFLSDDLARKMAEWHAKDFVKAGAAKTYGAAYWTPWMKCSEGRWSVKEKYMNVPGLAEYRRLLESRRSRGH